MKKEPKVQHESHYVINGLLLNTGETTWTITIEENQLLSARFLTNEETRVLGVINSNSTS